MEFDRSISKLEKEQEKRRQLAKKKLEREQRAQAQHHKMEHTLQLLAKQRAEEHEALERDRQIQQEIQQRLTCGVDIVLQLHVKEYDHAEDDKVALPASVLESLTTKNAFANGPVMFQIVNPVNSRISHCGVKEFTADEGTVKIPKKVCDCLQLTDTESSSVQLKYIVLPPISSVTFQPKLNAFTNVGPVKQVLEENLVHHTTLTKGDVITIWYRGKSYELTVTNIVPDDPLYSHGTTLINTDVVVDIDLSEEYTRVSGINRTGQEDPSKLKDSTIVNHPSTSSPNTSETVSKKPTLTLPDEPTADADGIIACKLKLPDGTTLTRRFLLADSMSCLFTFLHASREFGVDKTLQVSTRFPPRKFLETDEHQSFLDAGINSSHEVFFVEHV
mmetsp:Transcript_4975/g.7596  ORF Transcript_4975/g.7596 Transcript_4975/m.7596 type:complete len:389 (+) Transcript_4975:154-1320(+)|eukprot:CAMPEP_0185023252 /NCGR_PEP_ID=MMETSP1103-20130426/5936_1 /TAXON_ID=36769 /ORGANISM="Paraphysomonas bandaiensis, Strain Caron Lab Isolate" /LENGTH=388 /DNA_ID=CAMNT_0027555745 /DNA_START=147 /DNA_END=1313 /DNA_ORIENTATION=+